jgi:hypothetical protein
MTCILGTYKYIFLSFLRQIYVKITSLIFPKPARIDLSLTPEKTLTFKPKNN